MSASSSVLQKIQPTGALDAESIRADFPILKLKVNGKPLVYLDNAASSQMPQQVIDRMVRYQTVEHANIHRGVHYLSETATAAYEGARVKIQRFINAKEARGAARRPARDLADRQHAGRRWRRGRGRVGAL